MKSHRAAVVACIALLAVPLLGCGADDSDTGSVGAGVEPGTEIDLADFTERVEAAAAKVESLHVETDNEGDLALSGDSSGDFDYTQDPVAYRLTFALDDSTMEIVAVGPDEFTKMAGQWLKEPRTDDRSVDPLAQVADLLAEASSVTFVGEEEHDGEPVGIYEVTISFADAQPGVDLPEEVTFELWLDGSDRVVRMSGEGELGGGSGSSVTTISSYDEPVTVEAPPADAVVD